MTNPFDRLVSKLSQGLNATIQVCGDSTGQGLGSEVGADPIFGWVGRLATKIGKEFEVTVRYSGAAYRGWVAWSGYNQDATLVNGKTGAPTLTVTNGSMGGAQTGNIVAWINGSANLIPDPNPDVVLIAIGLNDRGGLATGVPSVVNAVRSRCPSAPIVITTQNRSTGILPTALYLPYWNIVSNYYVGSPLNLTPPLRQSGVDTNLWMLDTQQAYSANPVTDQLNVADGAGGLHPNLVGYQAQADWMYGFLPDPRPNIATTALESVVRGVQFYQALEATPSGVTWSVSKGDLPEGLALNTATGELGGTPVSYGGDYSFTIRATNPAGYDEADFSGTIDKNVIEFTPTNNCKVSYRALGIFYSASAKVKAGDAFVPLVIRS
jgi:lysophospholipase L1-like esterase